MFKRFSLGPKPGGLKYQITILVDRVVIAERFDVGASPSKQHEQAIVVCQRGSKIATTQAVPLEVGLNKRVRNFRSAVVVFRAPDLVLISEYSIGRRCQVERRPVDDFNFVQNRRQGLSRERGKICVAGPQQYQHTRHGNCFGQNQPCGKAATILTATPALG